MKSDLQTASPWPSAYKKGSIFWDHPSPHALSHSSAMFDSFDSIRFSRTCSSNQTLYGGYFESHTNNLLHNPASTPSNNINFVDSMNQLKFTTQSTVIPTRYYCHCPSHILMANTVNSNDTRETSERGTLDPSCLSLPWEGEKSHQRKICTIQSSGIRRQQAPYALPSSTARFGGASTSTSTTGCVLRLFGDIRTHRATPPRNLLATTDQVDEIMLLLNREKCRKALNEIDCPVTGCVQKHLHGRIQDFRRHLLTHLKKNKEICCKGMPWERFLRDHLFKVSMEERSPYTIPGEDGLWIGGCLKTFSRKDALKRHLKKNTCMA